MLYSEASYSSLQRHLSAVRPSASLGLSPSALHVILIVCPEDLNEALSYITNTCPKATLSGIIPFPDCTHDEQFDAFLKGKPKFSAPLLPLSALAEHPETAVLVYRTLWPSFDRHIIYMLFYALQHVAHVFMYPDTDPSQWSVSPRPNFYEQNREELEWVYAHLADMESRLSFASMIKALLTGNIGYIRLAPFRHYRHPITWPYPGDIVIDGGIGVNLYDTRVFAEAVGPLGRIYAFEPNPEEYASAQAELSALPEKARIELIPLGLFSEKKETFIFMRQSSSFLHEQPSENTQPCRLTDLDSFVSERGLPRVDVIKLDIEGAEVPCLRGVAHTIRRCKPRLLISAYHNDRSDLMAVPRAIFEIEPTYELYFAASYMFMQELVFYARPSERVLPNPQ